METPPDTVVTTAEDIAVFGRIVLNVTAKVAQERAGGFVFKDVSRVTAKVTRKFISQKGVPTFSPDVDFDDPVVKEVEKLVAAELDEEILRHTNRK